MITQKEYEKQPLSFWKGKKVRLLEEIRNGAEIFPKGALMEITGKHGGFALYSEPRCPTCGYGNRHFISKVRPTHLEIYYGKMQGLGK